MADGEDKSKSKDFYQVLGLKKECTPTELRSAYKKLALRWHPDRFEASGSSKFKEEATQNFQAIQQAYSVLSDDNKRFLYDVGAYDSDDDENGMGDFINEMAVMMSQTKPNENGEESFEELQELFEEMFEDGSGSFRGSFGEAAASSNRGSGSSSSSNHNSVGLDSPAFNFHPQQFCLGPCGTATKFQEGERSKKRNPRTRKGR